MRTLVPFLALFATIGALVACSDPVKPPPEPVKIVDGPAYFPMNDGDTWNYDDTSNGLQFTRKIDGDTTVNGILCKRIFKGTETDQAWTVDSEKFQQHLFDGSLWFEPPLTIPFDLVKGTPHSFSSLGRISDAFASNLDSVRTAGTLTFDGYITHVISDVSLDSCIKLDYNYTDKLYFKNGTVDEQSSSYTEIWAKRIGLINDGDLVLLTAVINGVEFPQQD